MVFQFLFVEHEQGEVFDSYQVYLLHAWALDGYSSKRLVMLFVWMPPQILVMRMVSVTYHPTFSRVSTNGWYLSFYVGLW